MNLKQAQYVKTIAECGSITAAAKKLFVSQPSLSQMLRQIEQEIGLPIFDRSTSPLRLTYAGEKYLYAAERILAANSELESQLKEIKQEHAGRLRLKESDRLSSTAALIRSLGGEAEELEEGLVIHGKARLAGGKVDSFGDHRIAMAAATAACGCSAPVELSGAQAVNKSYPRFWEDFDALAGGKT